MKETKKVGGMNDTNTVLQDKDKRLRSRSGSGRASLSSNGWNKLDPEYQAGKDSMLETIKAAIETKSLIAPLSYFVEDFAALNDAARLGSNLDVSPKAMEDCVMSSIAICLTFMTLVTISSVPQWT
eukprot:5976481-Ditylum_brightwellii.AAC.1